MGGLGTPESTPQIGVLSASLTRSKEVFSFEYEKEWLTSKWKTAIDPKLPLFSGKFYAPESLENFGVFLDMSPDRWGRTLMLRREALLAKKDVRSPKKLLASHFLLGVYDLNRLGGLRFRFEDSPFWMMIVTKQPLLGLPAST